MLQKAENVYYPNVQSVWPKKEKYRSVDGTQIVGLALGYKKVRGFDALIQLDWEMKVSLVCGSFSDKCIYIDPKNIAKHLKAIPNIQKSYVTSAWVKNEMLVIEFNDGYTLVSATIHRENKRIKG